MGIAFLYGNGGSGGGGGLNFRVLGGATAPSNPKENDIWVNTEIKIPYYLFDNTEPSGLAEGAVWIVTGESSDVAFNATEKNPIKVYPIGVMQCVGGALSDVFAHIYRNNEWVQFSEIITDLYLYKDGDMCEEITGGWVKFGSGTVDNTDAGLYITVPASWKNGGAQTANLIDVTDYNTIECKSTGDVDGLLLCVNKDGTDVATGTSNIPILGITGMCRIRFYSKDSGSTIDRLTVTSLCLKK